jgi:PleD family two-component response regulator
VGRGRVGRRGGRPAAGAEEAVRPIEVERLAAALAAKWAQARGRRLRTAELEALVAQRTAEHGTGPAAGPVRMDELEAVVRNRTAELRQAATHDELTGLPNRALFHDGWCRRSS